MIEAVRIAVGVIGIVVTFGTSDGSRRVGAEVDTEGLWLMYLSRSLRNQHTVRDGSFSSGEHGSMEIGLRDDFIYLSALAIWCFTSGAGRKSTRMRS